MIIFSRCAADLLGFSREGGHLVAVESSGNFKRGVVEGVPAILGHDLRRQWNAGDRQRTNLVAGHSAHTAHDVIFRREILPERGPLSALFADRKVTNHRLAILNGVPRAYFASCLTRPRDGEQIVLGGGRETGDRFVLRHVALESLGERRRGRHE